MYTALKLTAKFENFVALIIRVFGVRDKINSRLEIFWKIKTFLVMKK